MPVYAILELLKHVNGMRGVNKSLNHQQSVDNFIDALKDGIFNCKWRPMINESVYYWVKLEFQLPYRKHMQEIANRAKLMTLGNSSWVDLVKERGVSGEILENSNFCNLHNKITENMAGTITPSKHKYMSDVNPPEKNSGSTHGTTQC